MQIVKGFYDNGDIVLGEKINKYRGEIVVIFPIESIESIESSNEVNYRDVDKINNKRASFLGCLKGKGWISDDFNEPIDVMEDYM